MTNAASVTDLASENKSNDPNVTALAMEKYFLTVNPSGELRFVPWIWKHETNQVSGYVAFVVNSDSGKSQRRLKNVTTLADMGTLFEACLSRDRLDVRRYVVSVRGTPMIQYEVRLRKDFNSGDSTPSSLELEPGG